MSATSASTATSVGKCVVCGKETWMRCSACSKAGLDWMWFCSGEHQKLVWPVHKLVCNRYGNPFRWPGFSQAEADEILDLRHEGGITVKKGRPVTLEESCRVPSYELKKGETFDGLFEVFVLSLRQSQLNLCSSKELADMDQLAVPTLRHKLGALRAKLGRHEAVNSENGGINSSIFDVLFTLEINLSPDLIENPDRYAWLSTYRHKALIYQSICRYATYHRSPVTSRWATYTAHEIIRFMDEVVARTHPEIASTLKSSMVNVS